MIGIGFGYRIINGTFPAKSGVLGIVGFLMVACPAQGIPE
jgi:hypothetical protein